MKRRHYITIFLWFIWISTTLYSQVKSDICIGEKGAKYWITGYKNSVFNWNLSGGGSIVRDTGDTIWIDWGKKPGIYSLSVQEISEYGCAGPIRQMDIDLMGTPFEMPDPTICAGDSMILTPGNFNKYEWSNGSTQPTKYFKKEGDYWVEATDKNGCKFRDDFHVTISALPTPDLGEDRAFHFLDPLILNGYDEDVVYYEWFNGNIGSALDLGLKDLPEDGKIWVKAYNEDGCLGTDTINVTYLSYGELIALPDAFSPNGDGLNEVWHLLGDLSHIEKFELQVFTRHGELIYNTGNPANGWDGMMNGKKAPMGVYLYHMKMTITTGEVIERQGNVTLLR